MSNAFGVDFKLAKSLFFDRKAVSDAVSKGSKKILPRCGALLRRKMRQSMRRRKKASPPGTPPSAHGQDDAHPHGPQLKEKTLYFYDPATESVVAGPAKLGRSEAASKQEFGGVIRVKVSPLSRSSARVASPKQKEAFKRKIKDGSIQRTKSPRVVKNVHTDARPFARPALASEMPKFPTLYAGQITG